MENLNEKNQEKIQGGFGDADANECCPRCGSSDIKSNYVSPSVYTYSCMSCGHNWITE